MTHVYANLIGTWHDLAVEDPECKIGIHQTDPITWWKEGSDIWNPITVQKKDKLSEMPYVHIDFKGSDYRISPYLIQIVTD